ncbi:malto-oligosyltrehalose synthase [Fundidesulfovibrio putealis]|uniref:malto-oligosyltrehalose synthase n=1 Tax=Fundidesulfovibrio putealis TaxID=270496 RepID=UPI00040DD05E|nr:malto-oligosyltrehalose synthase [Fundidesulfovibrio putealis]
MIGVPLSTYRIQLRPGFGFAQCREVLSYLAALGVSHIYASPIFKARPGSQHGYDVCDHQTLNPELGTTQEFEQLMAACKELGLGWIQDIVPNHMAVSGNNGMLVDVLENGESSKYISYFDIEWDHPYKSMAGRMLAPFLGGYYSQALENGEIQLKFNEDGFSINYYDIKFPLRIDSYVKILTHNITDFRDNFGLDNPDYLKMLGILYNIKGLTSEKRESERYHQLYFIKHLLFELYQSSKTLHDFMDNNIRLFNGKDESIQGDRFALLDDLLGDQLFRLAFWKVAGEEINYRRFFSINDLISLRVEDEAVFDHTHKLTLEYTRNQFFSGLRIDHIDGLYDPTSYLQRLRGHAPDAYLMVEKVLMWREPLPTFWPIQGTTGYDFMNLACGLFVQPEAEAAFQRLYVSFSGMKKSLGDILADKKRSMIQRYMAGDVDNLARLVKTVSSKDRQGTDITLAALKQAITELLIQFPVYRTYISRETFRPDDLGYIRDAVRSTRRANPELNFELDFLERFLLLEFGESMESTGKREWTHFVMRFQQVTGPLLAKAMEDSTFYVMNRLLCLNEVGGDPGHFGIPSQDWHAAIQKRMGSWPAAMNTTATHDAKRGEDARMRLAALSELPELWKEALKTFSRSAKGWRQRIGPRLVPDQNEAYFLYQSILAHMPFSEQEADAFGERLKPYLVKAMREAKEHSNWLSPDEQAEQAYCSFADSLLKPDQKTAFMEAFRGLWKRVTRLGIINSLSQTLLKVTAPGFPDFYQGTELWDFSMVDPDNRRPVDFALRQTMLTQLGVAYKSDRGALFRELLELPEDGRIKLFLTWRALAARKGQAELFLRGDYHPLDFGGGRQGMAFGFARTLGDMTALSIVPRFFAHAAGEDTRYPMGTFWEDASMLLPGTGPFMDAFTGREFQGGDTAHLKDVFSDLPFALLISPPAASAAQT